MFTSHQWRIAAIAATLLLAAAATQAQSITGTVVDPTGAVVPNAAVEIHNPVSRYDRSTTTDASGKFSFQKSASRRITEGKKTIIAGGWFCLPLWGHRKAPDLPAESGAFEQRVHEPCPAVPRTIRTWSPACANWKYAWPKS